MEIIKNAGLVLRPTIVELQGYNFVFLMLKMLSQSANVIFKFDLFNSDAEIPILSQQSDF